jgi:DNA-binding NarL/FixJ family response regulator
MAGNGDTENIRVSISAADPLTRAGLVSVLRKHRKLSVTSADSSDVDVVVVTGEAATDDVLSRLSTPHPRRVLIVDERWRVNLAKARENGVRAVLRRSEFTATSFVHVLLVTGGGGVFFPADLPGVEGKKQASDEVLAPMVSVDFTPRDLDVLRLVAEGLDLQEISEKMAYSQRTIKNILSGTIKRLNARNRTQAVSCAIRSGLL